MMCLTCQFKLGAPTPMEEVETGFYLCRVCKTTKVSMMAAPVILARPGITGMVRILYMGGFLLLLLATVVFTTYPQLEIPLTWTMLYSLYLVWFGLAFANFRRKLYA